MTDYLRYALSIITRETPGRVDPELVKLLEAAPLHVQRDFCRIVRALEDSILVERRKARMFGRVR